MRPLLAPFTSWWCIAWRKCFSRLFELLIESLCYIWTSKQFQPTHSSFQLHFFYFFSRYFLRVRTADLVKLMTVSLFEDTFWMKGGWKQGALFLRSQLFIYNCCRWSIHDWRGVQADNRYSTDPSCTPQQLKIVFLLWTQTANNIIKISSLQNTETINAGYMYFYVFGN